MGGQTSNEGANDVTLSLETGNEKYDGTLLPTPDDFANPCGYEAVINYIVGGTDAKQGAYPFIALLGVVDPNNPSKIRYICGGSLINRRYVVTAAHCQTAKDPLAEVVLGEHDVSRDPDCPQNQQCKSGKTLYFVLSECRRH